MLLKIFFAILIQALFCSLTALSRLPDFSGSLNHCICRFVQFLESIEGINPKTLSVRLKEMEKSGLIKRKVFNESPIRVEYSVTEKDMALKPIIMQMAAFSMKYCSCEIFKDGKPRTVEQVFGKISSNIFY